VKLEVLCSIEVIDSLQESWRVVRSKQVRLDIQSNCWRTRRESPAALYRLSCHTSLARPGLKASRFILRLIEVAAASFES
jgi:hypothetical protein